jgi:hypothetical protein
MSEGNFDIPPKETQASEKPETPAPEAQDWLKNPALLDERIKSIEAMTDSELGLVPTESPAFEGIEDSVKVMRAELTVAQAEERGDAAGVESAKDALFNLSESVFARKEREGEDGQSYKDHYNGLFGGFAVPINDLHRLRYPDDSPTETKRRTTEILERAVAKRKTPPETPAAV